MRKRIFGRGRNSGPQHRLCRLLRAFSERRLRAPAHHRGDCCFDADWSRRPQEIRQQLERQRPSGLHDDDTAWGKISVGPARRRSVLGSPTSLHAVFQHRRIEASPVEVTGPARLTPMDTDRRSVFIFACLVAALVLISAYATDRNGAVDEPGFLNPPYMLAHFGRLTFPVFPFNGFFDLPVITHPPVHLLWIGLLWRLGFSIYYAEATPTVLLML